MSRYTAPDPFHALSKANEKFRALLPGGMAAPERPLYASGRVALRPERCGSVTARRSFNRHSCWTSGRPQRSTVWGQERRRDRIQERWLVEHHSSYKHKQ